MGLQTSRQHARAEHAIRDLRNGPLEGVIDHPKQPVARATTAVLALDIGSSSARVALYDSDGQLVGPVVRDQHTLRTTPDGGAELDADELLERACVLVDQVLAATPRARIVGVGLSTFWHSLLGVDADDRAVTPIFTWADTRASAAAAQLRRELDAKAVYARTGAPLHSCFWPAKLRWLAEERTDLYHRARRWMSFGEYLHLRLFGRTVASLSMASGTGLFDTRACTWDAPLLDVLAIRVEQVSQLGDLDTPLGALLPELARRWPRLSAAAWFPAVGDGACNNVGSGCLGPARMALAVGTSAALRVVHGAGESDPPDGLWRYRVDRRRLITGGALSEGGNVFAWLRTMLNLPDDAELELQLSGLPPDGHGLTVLPFLAGERSPGWAAHAQAAIDGLDLHTRPLNVLRAGLEAVALRFVLLHGRLRVVAEEPYEIVASGGALLRSPAWLQIVTDVLGRSITTSAELEASCRGAALLTLEALGLVADAADMPAALGATYQPDALAHARYQRALERQQELYHRLVDIRSTMDADAD